MLEKKKKNLGVYIGVRRVPKRERRDGGMKRLSKRIKFNIFIYNLFYNVINIREIINLSLIHYFCIHCLEI